MGSTITITLRQNSTIEVLYTSSATGVEDETRVYDNIILRNSNVNRVLFNEGRVPQLMQIRPPEVRDFINEVYYVLRSIRDNQRIDYIVGITRRFVDEFTPRLARVGDVIKFDDDYTHTRNGTVIFRITSMEARFASQFYGKEQSSTVIRGSGTGPDTVIDVAQLLERIQNYVNNVLRQ